MKLIRGFSLEPFLNGYLLCKFKTKCLPK